MESLTAGASYLTGLGEQAPDTDLSCRACTRELGFGPFDGGIRFPQELVAVDGEVRDVEACCLLCRCLPTWPLNPVEHRREPVWKSLSPVFEDQMHPLFRFDGVGWDDDDFAWLAEAAVSSYVAGRHGMSVTIRAQRLELVDVFTGEDPIDVSLPGRSD